MVVSWPARIQAQGEVRSQFASVVDVAPTLYEAAGVPAPATVDGVKQMPLEGVSFAASFARADAADRHKVQYFEIGGNRAIYKDGWMASTHPERLPWRQVSNLSPDQYRWELYDLTHDYAQAHDLAAQQPQKLAALKAAFDIEARKHQVYPIDNRGAARALMPGAPNGYPPRTHWSFPPSGDRYEYGAWPNVVGRSWTATAHIVAPATGGDGMIFTQGGRFGGYGLYVLNGVPTFSLRTSNTAASLVSIKGSALSPGAHDIRVAAKYAGGLAGAWDLTLSIDGAPAGQAHLARSFPFYVSIEGAAVGHDTGTPIVEDYRIPFAYSGTVQRVDFDLGPVAPPTPRAAALTKKATLARE
jgi:arylsulfatase